MTGPRLDTINKLFTAVNDYDAALFASLVTEDAVLIMGGYEVHHGIDGIYHGKSGAKDVIRDVARIFTSWATTCHRIIGEGDAAAIEWSVIITDFGGGQGKVDACAVADFDGDLIKRLRVYWRPQDMGD